MRWGTQGRAASAIADDDAALAALSSETQWQFPTAGKADDGVVVSRDDAANPWLYSGGDTTGHIFPPQK